MSIQPEALPGDLSDALARVDLGRLGAPLLFFSTIGSTNDVASTLAAGGDREGAVVIANAQTAGRGRRGRTWFSPPGAGLYVSVVLTPARASSAAERATALLTLAAGVALAEAIERATGLAPDIKWPNDLLIGRRKLAGILAEGVVAPPQLLDPASTGLNRHDSRDPASDGFRRSGLQAVVLGYGVNVSPAAYPADLSDRVTSIESELGRAIDRAALCAETLAALATRYDDLLAARFDAILDAWRARAPGSRGGRVSWETPSGTQSGVTTGIDDAGALLVRVGDRTERLVAGEVRWG
jgi:BirA family transcriptional regulator, biotin operon repressor / biotin---[acetyl-CoA-carboxylase] ligase